MIRHASWPLLALLACSSPAKPPVQTTVLPGHPLGETTHDVLTPAAMPDPSFAARQQFQNPGGMWMPMQMLLPQHVQTLTALGLSIPPATLADPLASPLGAVVWLGGCTGSFVSPDGLIVTNHHCAQGALQINSTPEANLVVNGFLAKNRADERSAGPAQRVLVALAFRDVTRELREGLDSIKDPIARKDESEKRSKGLIAACEKDKPGTRCEIRNFFRGGLYQLVESLELRDIRMVYVPHREVGDFGGEIDNWNWPRQTGDWSYFRAYVGKDGRPADYKTDNVPFKPKHWLKVSAKGVQPDDFVMVTGYPGTTNRLDTAAQLHNDVEWLYPYLIETLNTRYKIGADHEHDAGETGIKAGVMKQLTQNGLAKYTAELADLTKGDLVKRKDELDAQARAWAAEPGHEAKAAAIAKMDAVLADIRRTERADFDRGQVLGGSRLLTTALTLTRLAEEKTKPDAERKPGYQERDMSRLIGSQKALARQYDRTLDRAGLRAALLQAIKLPEAQRSWLATLLGVPRGRAIDEALIENTLDAWYKAPPIEDEKLRLELVNKATPAALRAASRDPFIAAAQRIWPIYKAEEKKADAHTGELLLVTAAYADALRAVLNGFLAPDANFSLRITYGTVKSFHPGSEPAFTTASSLIAKSTGVDPFATPPALLAALKSHQFAGYADPALDKDLPINFLSDLDTTGGNSGSPVLNKNGELVGLAFDGTLAGLASDAVFDGPNTRAISLDARYMLWVMDAVDGAHDLLHEMNVPLIGSN